MSLRPSSRAEPRRKSSKKTIDADEARKKREEVSIEIRKSKREEQMQMRRQFQASMTGHGADVAQPTSGHVNDIQTSSTAGPNNQSTIFEKL